MRERQLDRLLDLLHLRLQAAHVRVRLQRRLVHLRGSYPRGTGQRRQQESSALKDAVPAGSCMRLKEPSTITGERDGPARQAPA